MNIIYLILARKGSVRIKNKNLKKIQNKSLVQRSIEFTKKISKIENIVLSTDSRKIREIGIKQGLKIPSLRPRNLSKSSTSSYETARYEIEKYEKNNKSIDAVILIQPSTPFRSINTFKKLKKIFIKESNKPLITIKKLPLNSDRLLKKKKKYIVNYDNKKKEAIYVPNGSYFFISKKNLLVNKSFFSKSMNYYEIKNYKENIDIDNKEDLFFARNLLKKN